MILQLNLSDDIRFGFFEKKSLYDLLRYSSEDFEAWRNRENLAAINLKNKVQSPLIAFAETFGGKDGLGRDLTDPFRSSDVERYKVCYAKLHKIRMMRHLFNTKLKLEKERLASFRERRETLQAYIPKMLEWVEKNCDSALCSERIENFQRACEWEQANHWLQTYLNKENLKTLQARLRQIEKEKSECLKKLGAYHAKDAFKRIDLVVESGNQRLAIECDGDYWHGAEQYEADMERQRQLERCGWEFFRIRQSEFYADKISCLEPLWQLLRHRGMM